jgi:ATP-dependent Clp protease protease subunit
VGKGGFENGMEGQAADLHVEAKQLIKQNGNFCEELAKYCGQPIAKVKQDLKRDFYLTAAEAVMYGLVDHVHKPPQVSSNFLVSLV